MDLKELPAEKHFIILALLGGFLIGAVLGAVLGLYFGITSINSYFEDNKDEICAQSLFVAPQPSSANEESEAFIASQPSYINSSAFEQEENDASTSSDEYRTPPTATPSVVAQTGTPITYDSEGRQIVDVGTFNESEYKEY